MDRIYMINKIQKWVSKLMFFSSQLSEFGFEAADLFPNR
jgi:hypothetical protein